MKFDKEKIKRKFIVKASRALSKAQAWLLTKAFGEPFWVDTYGNAYTYKELRGSHLRNILRKLSRDGDRNTEVFALLLKEADSRRLRWEPKNHRNRWNVN